MKKNLGDYQEITVELKKFDGDANELRKSYWLRGRSVGQRENMENRASRDIMCAGIGGVIALAIVWILDKIFKTDKHKKVTTIEETEKLIEELKKNNDKDK